ncbi:MAG: HAD-IC family P-type ATPase [Clostridia bacterium]
MAKKKQNVIEQSKDFDSLTDDKIRDIVAEENDKPVESTAPKKIKPQSKEDMKEGFVRYQPDKKVGLTATQVQERQFNGLINRSVVKNKKSVVGIIVANLFTYFNLLCFLVAAALIYVGAWEDLTFMVVVLLNTIIGIVQEIRSKITIDKLVLNNATYSKVIRDGKKVSIPKEDIVLDDIVYLSTGSQISADSYVVDGNVEVNEALLTGESLPVKKKKGDMLLAGSFVSSGMCLARVENVGKENYIEQLSNRAKKYSKPKSELLYSLKVIIKVVGVLIIPFAILMYYNNFAFFNGDTYKTITKTAGSIIAMIPAGMFLLTSMALAVGVIRLAKKRTLVQELYCIEMLARANVLCLDKTGTLTDGSMKVSEVIELNKSTSGASVEQIITALFDSDQPMNMTAQALKEKFSGKNSLPVEKHIPFSSEKKFSGVVIHKVGKFKLGAMEYVLKKPAPELKQMVEKFSKKGLRVLVLVKCEDYNNPTGTPIAVIALEDNIRKDAPETIKWFKDNNVDIKIISGDNPITVSEIARRCGVNNSDKYISLQDMSKEEVVRAATKYTVFGRVSPEQKAILIKALKVAGKTVAMTGDGVNDILALKEADCSIAMAAGSDAARSVSHLVLLDSDFSAMPSVVAEGRRVVNNIQKSSSLFLMKTIFTILMSIFVLIARKNYPFSPIQFFLLELFVIGIPSFFLALQPNNKIIEGKFLANVMKTSLPAGFTMALCVVAIYIYQSCVGLAEVSLQTMGSIAVSAFGAIALFRFCKPFNAYKTILYICSMSIMAVIAYLMPAFFGYCALSLENWLFLIVVILVAGPIYNWTSTLIDSIKIPVNENKAKKI